MSKLLDYIVRCNNATYDDAVDDILKMADPGNYESRDEMEDHFEECLGYNPLTYFDRKFIEQQFDEVIVNAPYSVRDQLRSKHDEIIERTLECIDDVNDTILRKVFIDVIKDTIGWQPIEDSEVSLDNCISMAIFGSDNIDESSEYEDDDSDEDDFDDEEDLYEDDDDDYDSSDND